MQAGDQQAALFACGCWRKGDVSISLGTGSFVDVNTGRNVHSSLKGYNVKFSANVVFSKLFNISDMIRRAVFFSLLKFFSR